MATHPQNVLILGGLGMLAQAVRRSLVRRGVEPAVADREEADLTDAGQVRTLLEQHKPQVIYNCAAYTAVDKAEQEPELADAVNGHAVGHVADACNKIGARLVHVSTDFVFDGTATEPYLTTETPNPVSAYGRSKLLGERKLVESGLQDYAIVRTAWLYGPGGNNFVKTMVTLARKGTDLKIVDDQQGGPTFTHDLADALLNLTEANATGTYHVTNAGRTTWHGLTEEAMRVFSIDHPIGRQSAADYAKLKPDAAIRPAFSALDLTAYEKATGKTMRDWREALRDYHTVTAGEG